MTGGRPLPQGWIWAPFGSVARIESDLVDPKDHGNAFHIAPNHVESWSGELLPFQTVRDDKVTSPKHRFRPGQIIYSKIRPYLAKAAVVDFEGVCSADMYPVAAEIDTRYLHRWMLSPEFTEEVSRSQGRTVLPKVNQAALEKVPVPVPPMSEQRRIVAKLESLMERSRRAKEALDAIPPLLERYRQSVLSAAFRGDLTADWRAEHPSVEPAAPLLQLILAERKRRWEAEERERLRASNKSTADDRWKARYSAPAQPDPEGLPPLPKSWVWTSVESVGDVHLGRQRAPQYQTGKFSRPYLRVANIKEDFIDLSDLNSMDFDPDEYEHYRLVPGDILLSEGQSPELVGQSAVYRGSVEGLCFQKTLHRFRRHNSAPSSEFAQLVFRSYLRNGVFRQASSLTVNIAHLTLVRLKPLHFPLPPAAEQAEIVARVTKMLAAADATEVLVRASLDDLAKKNRSLLTRAFRGELVPQDPADEPASVLLDRIRAERSAAASSPAAPRARVSRTRVKPEQPSLPLASSRTSRRSR